MTTKKSRPDNSSNQDHPAASDAEGQTLPFTTSLDASIPGENIISIVYQDGMKRWIAVQCNQDGSFHLGEGNTEVLARRAAALRGLDFAEEEFEKSQKTPISDRSQKYLAYKDNLRNIVDDQREIINLLLLSLRGTEIDTVERPDKLSDDKYLIDTVIMMIQAIGVSMNSIYRLSENTEMTLRDCFPIARSIIETVVNIAFIMAGGEDAAKRAQRHALQKYYRDLNRRAKFGEISIDIQYTGSFDPTTIPELQEAIDEFTTNQGRERRSWTPESIDQRIEIIRLKYGDKIATGLIAGRFSIYRHASEIIHGTHFGTRYFWQPTFVRNGARSKDDFIEFLFDHFFTIFNTVYFSVRSLFDIFDQEYGMPSLRSSARKLNDELRELEFIKEHLEDED